MSSQGIHFWARSSWNLRLRWRTLLRARATGELSNASTVATVRVHTGLSTEIWFLPAWVITETWFFSLIWFRCSWDSARITARYTVPPAKASEPKPAADEPEDTRSEAEKNNEAIRDLRIKQLSATKDKEDYDKMLSELLKEYPTHLPLLLVRLIGGMGSSGAEFCILPTAQKHWHHIVPSPLPPHSLIYLPTNVGGDGAFGEGCRQGRAR